MDTIAPKPGSLKAILDYFLVLLLAVIVGPIAAFILFCVWLYEKITGRAAINDEPINKESTPDQTQP